MFGEIRTMTNEKGETFFVGKDVAKALGYTNTRDALRKHVDEEDKTTVAICDTGSNYKSQAVFINESGLYSLILSSKLPRTFSAASICRALRQPGQGSNDWLMTTWRRRQASSRTAVSISPTIARRAR